MSIRRKKSQQTIAILESITGEKLTLAGLLRAIRRSDEETIEIFAGKLGITKQHLWNIEQNRTSVSTKIAAIYATKLGYSRKQFVRLSLQDIIDRSNLDYEVKLKNAA